MAQTQSARASAIAVPELQPLGAIASRGRIIAILIGVILGMLLAGLDQTIVGTALPRIVASLGGLEHYAWVVTAYLLASTVSIPLYGKLSDIYGRRIFFLGGMVIFLFWLETRTADKTAETEHEQEDRTIRQQAVNYSLTACSSILPGICVITIRKPPGYSLRSTRLYLYSSSIFPACCSAWSRSRA